MLSRPASPPPDDRSGTDFTTALDREAAESDLSRRVERERLRSRIELLRCERDALRDRVAELEARAQTYEEQLNMAKKTIRRKDGQRQAIIDRYEMIIAGEDQPHGVSDRRESDGLRNRLSTTIAAIQRQAAIRSPR